jgi:hypothetical protein
MAKKPTEEKTSGGTDTDKLKRSYVSQANLPSRPLRDALRVAQAITDNYAGQATAPHDVALALELSPTSSSWRDLAASSLGYGLTKGSWSADKIVLDTLGRRATAPTKEGDDIPARAEAALRSKVIGGFFRKYNKAKLPPDAIARNVLQQEFSVPSERLDAALSIVKDNGQFVGFIRDTKTGPFVAIDDPQPKPVRLPPEPPDTETELRDLASNDREADPTPTTPTTPQPSDTPREFKVFISHGKTYLVCMTSTSKSQLRKKRLRSRCLPK